MAYAAMGDIASKDADAWYARGLDVLKQLRIDGLRAGGPLDLDEPELVSMIERKLSAER